MNKTKLGTHQKEISVSDPKTGASISALTFSNLPSENTLSLINELIPKGAEIVLKAIVQEAEVQQKIDLQSAQTEKEYHQNGQSYAIEVCRLSVVAAVILGLTGHEDVAKYLLGTFLAGIVGNFISGAFTSRKKH